MQIIKLGGSAITKKSGWKNANSKAIASLAQAVACAWKKGKRDLVIVHGAGSFGHALVLKYKIGKGAKNKREKSAALKTHAACKKLSSLVVKQLKKKGVKAISLSPNRLVSSSMKRIKKFNTKPIFSSLKKGVLPVLHGDMVPDEKLGFSVCSGDQIVSYLGKKAKRIILATNVDGILVKGKLVKKITKTNFAKIKRHIKGAGSPDVTGGMAGKIREIIKAKVPAYIVNAKKPKRLLALLLGKKALCTKIKF